jgi:hypothetical protein
MKKIILFLYGISAYAAVNLYAQCDTLKLDYTKVVNSLYAQKYSYTKAECPVIIIAEFFKIGLPQKVKELNDRRRRWWPGKIKNMIYFQCVKPGSESKAMPKTGEMAGDFFTIGSQYADIIANLQQGDKIAIMGYTYIQTTDELSKQYKREYPYKDYAGYELEMLKRRAELFFIVTGIRKIEK